MEKEQKSTNEFLGTGKVSHLLKMFAIPCVLSLIIQALYNLVDQIFIGHESSLGALGNAATGIVYPLTVIALGIGLWLGDGAAACMSLNQGKGRTKDSSKSIGTAISFGFIIGILLTIICLVFKEDILMAIGAKDTILEFSMKYATFIVIGFTFFIFACIINPIIRADGSPKFAMFAMAIGAVVNIILDPIFLYVFKLGMNGAALATFIGQIITFILHFVYLFKTKTFKLKIKDLLPDFTQIKLILKFGISSFLTQISIVIISIINNILLAKYSIASGYDTTITQGVITLAFKVFGIIVSIVVGIAAGGQPILGYNYGARKYDRVKQTYKLIMISTFIVGIIATILFEAYPQIFLYIFGNGGSGVDSASYEQFTILTFRIYLSFILLTCLIKSSAIFFQSIGKPIISATVSMCRDLFFLIPSSVLTIVLGGISAFLWSAPIADGLAFIVAVIFTIKTLKTLDSKKEETLLESSSIKESHQGLIITIARMHGSSGKKIGQELAKSLNIPFYDKEITSLVALKSGLSHQYISDVIEENVLQTNLYITLDPSVEASKAQNEILNKIAEAGSCVIVGRCADYVLKDYKPLRIFLYAPLEYRIKQIMESYNDDYNQALKFVNKSDKRRGDYYKLTTTHEWNNVNNYDLLIDTSIGVDKVVNMIKSYIAINMNK